MASVTVIGTGYVGLVTSLALAKQGFRVRCVDVDPAKVDAVNLGRPAFYEEGVAEALRTSLEEGRVSATLDGRTAVRDSDFTFLCVGTPPKPDGSMDDTYIRKAARTVGEGLRDRKAKHVVVVKSTVLPGTTESVVLPQILSGAGSDRRFGLCVNPEFLREGSALHDALNPDRIVIGQRETWSGDALEEAYAHHTCPVLRCDLRTAEMIKYATNAFLAAKISCTNELANLCGKLGMDWDLVAQGVGLDPRIGAKFLVPGVGFGGSCFSKDLTALIATGRERDYDAAFLRAVLELNERQPMRAIELLEKEIGDLAGKKIAILGLAFKAGTSDVRESRAMRLSDALLSRGAKVVGYDPVAGPEFVKAVPQMALVKTRDEALADAWGCIIQADWPEFRAMTARDFGGMAKRIVIDGRRTLESRTLGGGVIYRRIG